MRFSPEDTRSIIVPVELCMLTPRAPIALTRSQNAGLSLASWLTSMKPTPDFSAS